MKQVSQPLKLWQYIWRLIRFHPWWYLLLNTVRITSFVIGQQVAVLITRAFFNHLTGDMPLSISNSNSNSISIGIWGLSALLVGAAVGHYSVFALAMMA